MQETTWVVATLEDLPREILERHGNVTLEANIMYINEVTLIITVSRAIHF